MGEWTDSCPLSGTQILDEYFLEHRAKLLDVAAFLDRVERATDGQDALNEYRLEAFRNAIGVLNDGRPERARRLLEVFSDPTDAPIERAGTKGASGAYPGKTVGGTGA